VPMGSPWSPITERNPKQGRDGSGTYRACVALVLCCLSGVLFLRGATAPERLSCVLPPALGVAVGQSRDVYSNAPAHEVQAPDRIAPRHTRLAFHDLANVRPVSSRSQLLDVALPPPTVS